MNKCITRLLLICSNAFAITLLIFGITKFPVYAHPGNTESDGCHYCRTNCAKWGEIEGVRHCHGSSTYTPPSYDYSRPIATTPSCPSNSYYSYLDKTCTCNYGYELSSNRQSCIKPIPQIPTCPINSYYSYVDSACTCNYGYDLSLDGRSCIKPTPASTSCPINAYYSYIDEVCTCDFGYEASADKTFCIKSINTEVTLPTEDVPANTNEESVFDEYINNLKNKGIVKGYSDGTFRPENAVTRGELAKFIYYAFDFKEDKSCDEFPDVKSTDNFYIEIMSLKCAGIVNGFSDGTYHPENYVTRGEVTKYITKAFELNGIDTDYNLDEDFADVDDNDKFIIYIAFLSSINFEDNKIISGYSNGNFGSLDFVTRGQISKIIDIAMQYMESNT